MGVENFGISQGRRSRRSPLRAAGVLKPDPTVARQWCLSIQGCTPTHLHSCVWETTMLILTQVFDTPAAPTGKWLKANS